MTLAIATNVERPMCHLIEILSLSEFQKHQGRTFRLAPPNRIWIAAARQAAQEANVPLKHVLGGSKSTKAATARWKAWASLIEANPRYSIAGIARVSGWHHASVLYAMRRLKGEAPESARRAPKASIVT